MSVVKGLVTYDTPAAELVQVTVRRIKYDTQNSAGRVISFICSVRLYSAKNAFPTQTLTFR